MAIIINEMKLPLTPKQARDYIQENTDHFGVFFDVERCFELCGILHLQNKRIVKQLRSLSGNAGLAVGDKDKVISALCEMGVAKSEFFRNSDTAALNADVYASILSNKNYSVTVHKFIELYANFTSNNRNIGYFKGLASLPQPVVLPKTGIVCLWGTRIGVSYLPVESLRRNLAFRAFREQRQK